MDEFREKQRVNGLKGGRPLKDKTQTKPNNNPNKSSSIEDRSKKIEDRKKEKGNRSRTSFRKRNFF